MNWLNLLIIDFFPPKNISVKKYDILDYIKTKGGAMLMLAKLIGAIVMVMGIIMVLNEKTFIVMLNFWKKGKNVHIAGAIRFALGIFFVFIAPACRFSVSIFILGILMIIGGAAIFVLKPNRVQAIFDWLEKRPPVVIRLISLLVIAIGELIIYSI